MSPGRRPAIIRTNAGLLLIGLSGTNFNGIVIKFHVFIKKIHLKISSLKWRHFCHALCCSIDRTICIICQIINILNQYICGISNLVCTNDMIFQQKRYRRKTWIAFQTIFLCKSGANQIYLKINEPLFVLLWISWQPVNAFYNDWIISTANSIANLIERRW